MFIVCPKKDQTIRQLYNNSYTRIIQTRQMNHNGIQSINIPRKYEIIIKIAQAYNIK